MNRLVSFVVVLFFTLFLVPHASAHTAGQKPFFKVDGKLSDFYPVSSNSINKFVLPQDIGPEIYLVNKEINFEIDTVQLPIPKDILDKTIFTWDYEDGSKGEGLKNTHVYAKKGSYVLTIYADTSKIDGNTEKQLLQSTMLHVIPDRNYKIPQSEILINGIKSKNALTDPLHFNLAKPLLFDASSSQSQAKITEYIWDFGDTTTSKEVKTTHSYGADQQPPGFVLFASLRIKNADGFISDSYVQITSDPQSPNVSPSAESTKLQTLPLVIGGVAVFIILFLIFSHKFKKHLK